MDFKRRCVIGVCSIGIVTSLWAADDTLLNTLHLDWLDTSVPVSQDFYTYANGTWQKKNPIPPAYASWGSFYVLQENVQNHIHDLLIAAADDKTAKPGSIEQKIGDFYFSGMDEISINKLGISPLQPELLRIEGIQTAAGLQQAVIHLQQIGVNVCFNFGSMADFNNSNHMIGAAEQGGLGLPDRDYYLKQDAKFKHIRTVYMAYITELLQRLGDSPTKAQQEADVVMKIETALAKASLSQTEQRDPHAIYHMKRIEQLNNITPHFSWPYYLKAMGLSQVTQLNLAMPNFFKRWDELLQTESLADWKIYLRWHLLSDYAPYLSKPFVDAHFRMTSALTGAKTLLPRWKRVVRVENEALGFAIGDVYVKRYFSPKAQQEVLQMLRNIKGVLRQDLSTLSWMTTATRREALEKLELMSERVGYPNKPWDYSSLFIDRGPYVLNVMRANAFLFKRDLSKIDKPVDKSEWAMTPQTINAYYDPSMNNINIPAGILQSPFFDVNAPAAVNYGAIGFVIGHEMTHGFDDQGAQFDGHGNLKNWWTAADLKKFQAATHCIMMQYSQYKVDDDLSVQGPLVMGEATADLGGVMLAYRAFHESNAYKTAPTIAGFTPDQQFFLSVAHVWAGSVRPEQLRHLVTVDPHPPMKYRVNGTLSNVVPFQKAFSIPDTSPMVQSARCVIW